MPYTNRKSLKYEDCLETNKIYRRPPYILNNSNREKYNSMRWEWFILSILFFYVRKEKLQASEFDNLFFHMLTKQKVKQSKLLIGKKGNKQFQKEKRFMWNETQPHK